MADEAVVQEAPGAEPSAEAAVSLPKPISTENTNSGAEEKPAAQPSAPEKPKSVRESLEAAAAKANKSDEDKAKAEAQPEKKADAAQPRGEHGHFVGKEAGAPAKAETAAPAADPKSPHAEAPSRFSSDAKAAWATAPEPVKAEVHRAMREMEQGLSKYKTDAESYQPFREFHDLAKSLNVDPARALREYVTLDKMLGENFPQAMARICQNKRVDIRAFAADILQLTPEQRAGLKIGQTQQQARPVSPEVLALRQEIAQLKQQIGGVSGTLQQQQASAQQTRETEVAREIEAFKASNPPLFDELGSQIAALIANEGLSLKDAHARAYQEFQEMAQRAGLIPRSAAAPADREAQTLKGQKSITGAPGAGSTPVTQKPSSSIREALQRAMQAA